MKEKTVGVLGGMGPEATLDCFAQILANSPATRDQEHLRVVIDSNPKVPDRTAAVLGTGPSPAPVMIAGCEALARAGADFIIIPCITAHVWFEEVAMASPLPLISMFDVVAEAIRTEYPDMGCVGLVGTTGTIRGGLFQKRLAEAGLRVLAPCDEDQQQVMAAIYDIKNAAPLRSREAITVALAAVSGKLLAVGAQGIVAACTEIPLALAQKDLSCPYFNSLRILARAAIRYAGLTPTP